MATLTMTIGSFTASKTIAANDLTRLLNAYKTVYGQVPVDPTATSIVMKDLTNQEVFDKFSQGFFQSIVNQIKSAEQQLASQTAAQAVVSVVLT